ncbi:NADH-quinone oxidoreductase subunit L, partial [Francisella tularensis subsp. holarctica]|nr:NADH-quinone oxidoreductase subunit L [Francisella tularensis subsp. holarctica]
IIYHILVNKYFIDALYDVLFVNIFFAISNFFLKVVDIFIIDKTVENGTSNVIYHTGDSVRKIQRGYLGDYALVMMGGVF